MVYSNRRRDSRPSTSVVPTRRTRTSGLWPVRSEWCPVRILSGGNHGSRMTTPSPARWFRKQRSVCATRSSVFTYPMELKRQRMTSRSEEHTSELQSHSDLVCRLLLEKKKQLPIYRTAYKILTSIVPYTKISCTDS